MTLAAQLRAGDRRRAARAASAGPSSRQELAHAQASARPSSRRPRRAGLAALARRAGDLVRAVARCASGCPAPRQLAAERLRRLLPRRRASAPGRDPDEHRAPRPTEMREQEAELAAERRGRPRACSLSRRPARAAAEAALADGRAPLAEAARADRRPPRGAGPAARAGRARPQPRRGRAGGDRPARRSPPPRRASAPRRPRRSSSSCETQVAGLDEGEVELDAAHEPAAAMLGAADGPGSRTARR